MLKAAIHGKLSSDGAPAERLEDALTSNVFGSLEYADAIGLMLDWLGEARSLKNATLRSSGVHGRAARVIYWPRMPGVQINREPDVLVLIGDAAVAEFAICIEAKLDAGLSDRSPDEEPTEERPAETGKQLVDQFEALLDGRIQTRSGDSLQDRLPPSKARFIVFLTKAHSMPEDALEHASALIRTRKGAGVDQNIFWLNWSTLAHRLASRSDTLHLAPGQKQLLLDLGAVLRRMGLYLDPFTGFRDLPSPPRTESCGQWLRWLTDERE